VDLEKKQLETKTLTWDGNGLFRVVADQLDGRESNHACYRESCVNYIRDNEKKFARFIQEESLEEYCKRMR